MPNVSPRLLEMRGDQKIPDVPARRLCSRAALPVLSRANAPFEKGFLMSAEYVIGIDLGTTNSVVAYAPLIDEDPEIQLLEIPQVVSNGTIEDRSSLPSFLFLNGKTGSRIRSPVVEGPGRCARRVCPSTICRGP